ncbi:hypothetical protein FRC12_007638 [Ceratobasidium sp. 428]|nr:hypothetical protein FRC12_007638 [Ceratobasidium sp. 428]
METQEDKIPEIKIEGFVFADQQLPLGQTNDKQVPFTNLQDNIRAGHQAGFDFRRPEAYERMAADKLGEELAPDATIWRLYLEEAYDHDQELVKGRHASLDMLLLFAALFSAILTAFLIEPKDLLQQDPADVSIALMLAIAQSQYRMEQGASATSNTGATPPTIPEFIPSMTARWINGIWFTSLAFSLSAALVAMLGKEWLTAFLASRPRPAHAHALLRQSRLEGLNHWWALHIIALLPSFLHVSLLLFSVGLVLYLSTMDGVIAAVVASIVGLTSLFYVVTAILGAIYDFCPFVTELSKYVQRVSALLLRCAGAKSNTPDVHPLLKSIQALLWLSNHARDPAVVDCSCQALSGLPSPVNKEPGSSVTSLEIIPTERPQNKLPMILGNDTTLNTLLASTISRFERLTAGSLDMLGNPDLSVARYMSAIMRILGHTLSEVTPPNQLTGFSKSPDPSGVAPPPEAGTGRGLRRGSDLSPGGVVIPAKMNDKHPRVSLFQLLDAIETLWGKSSLPLGTDTYASVLISTAKIIQLAVSVELTTESEVQYRDKSNAHVSIEFASTNLAPAGIDSQLANLRAHYSRWLARVTVLLKLHGSGRITIESLPLDDILGAITIFGRCRLLNPVDCVSSHHPQPGNSASRTFSFVVMSNKGSPNLLQSNDLHTGLLGTLIDILRIRPGLKDESSPSTCIAALKAYSVLAPVLLQHNLGLPRDELIDEFERDDWEPRLNSDMEWLRFIAVRLALLTARYLVLSPKPVTSNRLQFLDKIMLLVHKCFRYSNTTGSKPGQDAYASLIRYGEYLIPLLELRNEGGLQSLPITPYLEFILVNLAGLQCCEDETSNKHTNLCEALFTPKCFPPLITMVEHTGTTLCSTQQMLRAMVRRMRGHRPSSSSDGGIPAIEYLRSFTSTSQGFSALVCARRGVECAEIVEETMVDIIHLAAGHDPLPTVELVELRTPAVPGFLDVVSVVSRNITEPASVTERITPTQLIQLSNDSLDLMKVAVKDPTSLELIRQHSACQDLWKAIRKIRDDTLTEDLMKRLLDAQEELGIQFEGRYSD